MKLTYIYHSGFAIETGTCTIIIDYYHDSGYFPDDGVVYRDILTRSGKLYVLATHFHPDHFNIDVLKWKEQKEDITYIFSKDILKRRRARAEDAIYIRQGETYRDDLLTIRAFGSTDAGVSFLIETGGKQIFHAGDLNNWHWTDSSTPEESAASEAHYMRELALIVKEVPRLDLLLFPVDARIGSDYMRGAEQFIDRIPTSLFSPMHFTEAYAEAAAFRPFAEARGVRFITWTHKGQSVEF
ncbi:MAG: MBL fold metallo-hydrolase [Tannerellaceae bacterium]